MSPILTRLQDLQSRFAVSEPSSQATLPVLDSYRVFHGRGKTVPGLEFVCIDFFQPVLLLTCYQQPPAQWLEDFLQQAEPLFAPHIQAVLVQHRYITGAPSQVVWGELPEKVYAQRGNLRFNLYPGQQQNTGFFLDMEPGRQWIEKHVQGRRVLNLFAYTCAFSVVAVAAGAEKVVNVDMSSRALQIGRDNHMLNQHPKGAAEFIAENILKSWGRIKKRGPYDVVILDPPSYQPGSFIAQKDYARLVRRLPELMPQGGMVLACLNAPELTTEFLQGIFLQECPNCIFEQRLAPSQDFPDVDAEQQLKLLVFRLPGNS
jgi:Predicted SAM-dependent methyltransferases